MTDLPPHLTDLIQQNAARLTEADTRLLEVLVRDPIRAAMENGKEVSFRAGVHPASAVRLARRLGFAGYPEFRAYLQANLIEGEGDFENPAARMAARLARAEEGALLSSLLDSEISALDQLRNSVSDADIRGFAETLRDARRIYLFGRGHAAVLTAFVTMRLRRSGYDALDLSPVTHQLAEHTTALSSGDVVWLMAFRSTAPLILEVATLAEERGAAMLALCDVRATRIEPEPTRQITVSRGAAGESQSLVVPMTVANAVILDLAAIDEGKSLRALEHFREQRKTLPPHFRG